MRGLCATVLTAAACAPASGSTIIGLGHVHPTNGTQATGISADGQFVIGASASIAFPPVYTPLRWSVSGTPTVQTLPFPQGWTSARPTQVSANGGAVSGSRQQGADLPAFRWTQAAGSTAMTNPAGWSSVRSQGLSPDGSTVVGWATVQGVGGRAVQWINGAQGTLLAHPPALISSAATVFDANSRAYGSGLDASGATHLLRWTGGVASSLATLPGDQINVVSTPFHASADGGVIGGVTSYLSPPQREEAWVWTPDHGLTTIPLLPGMASSLVSAVSADGQLVLGAQFDAAFLTQAPFVWTRSQGTLPLHQFLSSAGVDLSGWTLGSATGISADGTRIVGTGVGPAGRPEAYMAVIPAPGAAALALVGLPAAARRRRAR